MGDVVQITTAPANPRARSCWACAEARRTTALDEPAFAERWGKALGSVIMTATAVRQIEAQIVEPSGSELITALMLAREASWPTAKMIALQLLGG